MESEVVVWLVIIAFWLLTNLISFLRKLAAKKRQAQQRAPKPPPQRPGVQPSPQSRPQPQQRPGVQPSPQPQQQLPGARRSPPPPPPAPQPAAPKPAVEDALTQLLKSFGVDIQPSSSERPVASEHVPTLGEHAQAASQTRGTPSEHDHSPGWHQRTAAETTRTVSEHSLSASFHRRSASEHQAGDVFLPARPLAAPATAGRRPGSRIGRWLLADLHRDRDSLARAILLREVLGPPVGQRSPGQRSFER